MPTTYTPNATNNPSTITLPSDLDNATAESVNAALRALGDKSAFAIATRAAIAAVNEFLHGQVIDPPTENEAALVCHRYPGQITSGNRWALVFEFDIESSRSLRMYTGALGGVGRMAWTINARWNVTDQLWELPDAGGQAAAILWTTTDLTFHNVPIGTTPFLSWPTTGSDSNAGSLRAVGEFRYATTKTRVRTIPVSSFSGPASASGADGSIGTTTVGDHSYIRWAIRIPPGAVLQKINVMHFIDSSAVETFKLTRRRTVWDPGSPSTPPESVLTSVDSDSSTGTHITSITTSTAVGRDDELCLLWVPSGALFNNVNAISVEWADQGPTPI